MSYPRIAAKVAREQWSLEPSTFRAILHALNNPDAPGAVAMAPAGDSGADDTVEDYLTDGVAVIRVHGIIGKHMSDLEMACGGCSLDAVRDQLSMAEQDDNIRAVVLDINSPGGTVTGLPEITALLRDYAKPVVAFTDSQCCSAALWIAHSAQAFYATPSAHVGSVGVYIMLLDASRHYEMEGIKHDPVYNGEFKLAGASFKPLTDAERAMFQAQVDKTASQFKAIVKAGHDVADEFLEGQVYDGEDAERINMVDSIVMDIQEVVDLVKLAAFDSM